jgi:hypothetical protein
MLSIRLIHKIEQNWEHIAASVVQAVERNRDIPHYQALSDVEIHERARDLVKNLGFWLTQRDDAELNRRYEALGRQRHAEQFPLHEVVVKLQLLKRKILSFARDQHLAFDAAELYAEQDLYWAIDAFFDRAVLAVVKGYSDAHLQRLSAAA